MRYRARDLPALLATPLGRAEFASGLGYRAWPLAFRLAMLHRRTLARRARFVAVVGTYGKTTTARAVLAALGQEAHARLDLNAFTPAARAVLRVRPGDRHAVIEIGIRSSGWMARYARMVRPDVAVVTSVGSEHHRSLGTLETTRTEKAEMVRALPASGLAVLNGDDPNVRWMAGETDARVVTFGLGPENDVRASDVLLDWPERTRFTLHAGDTIRPVRARLLGRSMVYAILAALAVALAEGVELERALPALEALPPTRGRLQPVRLPGGAILVRDEFKSALETVDAALDLLAEVPADRRIVVLGDVSEPPGSQGPIYRRLGARVAGIATRAVFVGGSFQPYAAGARRSGMPRDELVHAATVREAVEAIRADLRPADVILLKGRNTQRLERIALALTGRQVGCELRTCPARSTRCDACPMLERGWDACAS